MKVSRFWESISSLFIRFPCVSVLCVPPCVFVFMHLRPCVLFSLFCFHLPLIVFHPCFPSPSRSLAPSLPRSSAFPTLLCQVRVSVCCSVCPVCFLLFCHYVDLSQLCSPYVSFFLVTLRSSVMFTPCLQISSYPRQVFMFKVVTFIF